jgi:NADH:ubiquinone oxidoreductase subunit 6 (subunit J)
MKLTKQEWCVVVMAVCLLGMAGAVVTLAGLWLWVNLPVLFWVAVYVGCAAVLMLIVTWRWRTEERHARRQEMHLCPHCGKLLTLGEYLGHTCHTKETP